MQRWAETGLEALFLSSCISQLLFQLACSYMISLGGKKAIFQFRDQEETH